MFIYVLAQFLLFATSVHSACECGFVDEEGRTWMDALVLPFNKVPDVHKSPDLYSPEYVHVPGHGSFSYSINPANTYKDGDDLALHVKPAVNGVSQAAEIATRRKDILYGTFRSVIQFPKEAGTCIAFFTYYNDTQEIDVEYIGQNRDYLYLSSKRNNPNDHSGEIGALNLPYKDLYNVNREYRFDWMPNNVTFYVDGKNVGSLIESPSAPSRVMLMNWSSGDKDWTGIPKTDVIAKFRNMNFFFNSSHPYVVAKYNTKCAAAKAAGRTDAFCQVSSVSLDKVYGYNENVLRGEDTFGTVDNSGQINGPSGTSSSSGRNIKKDDPVWWLLIVIVTLVALML